MRNKWAMSFRRPIGVAGIITPFNFPWRSRLEDVPALLCGNACIFKQPRMFAHRAYAGRDHARGRLPPEVIQLVHGLGEAAGAAIVNHPLIPVISFTGSTETGRIRGRDMRRLHKRLSLEMAGRMRCSCSTTPISIWPDGVLWGAFGTTGQRCTATSRLVLQDGIHDTLLSRLVDRARTLKLGDGRKSGTDVGR